jgi:hypothetical protein
MEAGRGCILEGGEAGGGGKQGGLKDGSGTLAHMIGGYLQRNLS